jgi:hypothetical protein
MDNKRKYSEAKLIDWIKSNKWTFAKTFAKFAPHEYLVINKKDLNEVRRFRAFIEIIREYGYEGHFGKRVFKYFEIDGYKYWTMGAPVEETIIINREPLAGYDKQGSLFK